MKMTQANAQLVVIINARLMLKMRSILQELKARAWVLIYIKL